MDKVKKVNASVKVLVDLELSELNKFIGQVRNPNGKYKEYSEVFKRSLIDKRLEEIRQLRKNDR